MNYFLLIPLIILGGLYFLMEFAAEANRVDNRNKGKVEGIDTNEALKGAFLRFALSLFLAYAILYITLTKAFELDINIITFFIFYQLFEVIYMNIKGRIWGYK